MKTIAILLSLSCLLIGSPIPDFPFIYVKGDASEQLPTSVANIRFELVIHSRNSAEGETALSNANRATKDVLRGLGIKNEEIQSSDVLKRQEFAVFPGLTKKEELNEEGIIPPPVVPNDSEKSEKKETFFTFRQGFFLKMTNLKLYPEVARQLMRSKDVTSYDVEFAATNREAVIEKLRIAAFADAKQAAENIAKLSGETLGRVHSASEMPYSDLSNLIGQDAGSVLYSMGFNEDAVYEVPPTVSESFGIHVLFRLEQGNAAKSETPK